MRLLQDVKVFIQGATQLPANKQKLSLEGQGVLKDSLTLAFYNVSSGTEFSLQLKTRGGK
jgi:splicing factor 3A subunit 1